MTIFTPDVGTKGVNHRIRQNQERCEEECMASTQTRSQQEEYAIQFLLAEHRIAAEEIWKLSNSTWNVFRFYITLLTAAGGFVLALASLNTSWDTLSRIIAVAAVLVFVIGITVYIQLLRIDNDSRRALRRIELVREQIIHSTLLRDYHTTLKEADADLGFPYEILGYSSLELVKRAIRGGGLKTQLVLINSSVGMIGVVASAMAMEVNSVRLLLALGIGSFILLTLMHGFYATLRGG